MFGCGGRVLRVQDGHGGGREVEAFKEGEDGRGGVKGGVGG
jgi:hypothetical protein